MTERLYDLFVSYSNEDGAWVRSWLLPRLEQAGLRVCIDFRDFEVGLAALINMELAVERSRRTLLVLSPNWVASEWAEFEALLAQSDDPMGLRRSLLPIMLERCELPKRLEILTWADFREESRRESELARIRGQIEIKKAEKPEQKQRRDHAFRVLVLATTRDLGKALEATVAYLRDVLKMDAAPGTEDTTVDPTGYDLVVLVQAWWWAGGVLEKTWSAVPDSERALFLIHEDAEWPPRKLIERGADDAIDAFRERHAEAANFSDPGDLPELIGELADRCRRSQQAGPVAAGLSETERAYLKFRLPTWKTGRTGAKGTTGSEEIYEERFYISLDGASARWSWDEEGDRLELSSEKEAQLERAEKGTLRKPLAWWASRPELRWLVLSGSPGGGKTVFLTRFAAALAEVLLGGGTLLEPNLEPSKLLTPAGVPVPITLEATALAKASTFADLVDAVHGQLLEVGTENPPARGETDQALRAGHYLILIDALDEITGIAGRKNVLCWLESVAEHLQHARLILTTRAARYTGALSIGEAFDMIELTDLSEDQVTALCTRFQEVKGETPDFLARLLTAVQEVENRGGRDETDLVGNPLLLASACSVFYELSHLPNDRAALCFQIVAHLCRSKRSEDAERGWSLKPEQKRDLLERIALAMQRENAQVWPMTRIYDVVAKGLGQRARDRDFVKTVVKWVIEHTGLLYIQGTDQGEAVRFHHRLFREYLAASQLTRGNQTAEDLIDQLWREQRLTDPAWLDVLRLIPGAMNSNEKAEAIAHRIEALTEADPRQRGALSALLASILVESKNLYPNYEIDAFVDSSLAHYEQQGVTWERATRLLFLESIGWLGDPRLDPKRADYWVAYQPARFTMGGRGFGAERKQEILEPYWLARFPVTNAEYRVFVEDGGYSREDLWHPDGWEWIQLEGDALDQWFAKNKLGKVDLYIPGAQPSYWGNTDLDQPNQPVVGVSWYEADAYCQWLTRRWAVDPPPWWRENEPPVVMLPSEAEWEFATRGTGGRSYPWLEGEPSTDHANYRETGLGRTSAVGAFPAGATPERLADMVGNVWEWCRSDNARKTRKMTEGNSGKSEGEQSVRVLRGGAWNIDADFLRASARSGDRVWNRCRDIGFRCRLCVGGPSTVDR